MSQLVGSLLAVVYAVVTAFVVYKVINAVVGFRLEEEQEFNGPDLSVHHINAYPEENVR